MDEQQKAQFQATVWQFYDEQGRHDLPWRQPRADGSFDPYHILVSEIMLQQTQVPRVIPKYFEFLDAFPTVDALAAASLGDVLRLWNGLGYNRRAKFLWSAAQEIKARFHGVFPRDVTELVTLPGVGVNTAGAVAAYAFNSPVTFIETNIRTVYIHHFFADQKQVDDKALTMLVHETVDSTRSREWYWALMDYGSFLKSSVGNKSRASKAYVKQSTFKGSNRQLRGAVIRALLDKPHTTAELAAIFADERLDAVLAQLAGEGLIRAEGGRFSIT